MGPGHRRVDKEGGSVLYDFFFVFYVFFWLSTGRGFS